MVQRSRSHRTTGGWGYIVAASLEKGEVAMVICSVTRERTEVICSSPDVLLVLHSKNMKKMQVTKVFCTSKFLSL